MANEIPRESQQRHVVKAVAFESDGWWVGVCLEPYLAVQAKTWQDLLERIKEIIGDHAGLRAQKGLEPFEDVKPAPRRYWDMWESASLVPRDLHSLVAELAALEVRASTRAFT